MPFELTQDQKDKYIALRKRRIDRKIQALKSNGGQYTRDALAFSHNDLTALDNRIFDVLFSDPVDAFVLLPLNTSVPDGATEYKYLMKEPFGVANTVADGSTDRNMAEQNLTETATPIYEGGSGYTYTVGDQARSSSALLSFNYVADKAAYAAEMIARWHNEFALFGGANIPGGPASVTGFLNNANVANGLASGGDYVITDDDWTTVTAAGQYDTITDIINQVSNGSNGVHSCTDLVMSNVLWNLCNSTRIAADSLNTVLTALRTNFPDVTFRMSQTMARGGSDADHHQVVAYERSSENAEYVASVVYDEAPPDKAGFRNVVHSRGRAAGTVIRRPLAIAYGDIDNA